MLILFGVLDFLILSVYVSYSKELLPGFAKKILKYFQKSAADSET